MQTPQIILASTSATRQRLLHNAGMIFTCQNPSADETAYKSNNLSLKPEELALALADLKAKSLAAPNSIVIGADQILSCNGTIYNKAQSMDEARACLLQLRGKTHTLHSAISICQAGKTIATAIDHANLTMRKFTTEFLDHYLVTSGNEILSSVGCYQLEKQGAQLFEEIKGDYFTILGFPLLPCLAILRQLKVVNT